MGGGGESIFRTVPRGCSWFSDFFFPQIAQIPVRFPFGGGVSLLLPGLELHGLSCLGALLDRLQLWNMEQFLESCLYVPLFSAESAVLDFGGCRTRIYLPQSIISSVPDIVEP